MQIASGLDGHVDQAMSGNLVEHVFKEGNANVKVCRTRSIKVDGNIDLGFQSVARDTGLALGHDESPLKLSVKGGHYTCLWPGWATADLLA